MYFFVIEGSTPLGLYESLHIFQVETGGCPPNRIVLFWMFSYQHFFLYFQGCFGALNNVFLACHSQTIEEVKVWRHNVYFSKRPFQWAITRLKHRSYEKITTLASWGTKLPQLTRRAHINFGVSPCRVRFFDVLKDQILSLRGAGVN